MSKVKSFLNIKAWRHVPVETLHTNMKPIMSIIGPLQMWKWKMIYIFFRLNLMEPCLSRNTECTPVFLTCCIYTLILLSRSMWQWIQPGSCQEARSPASGNMNGVAVNELIQLKWKKSGRSHELCSVYTWLQIPRIRAAGTTALGRCVTKLAVISDHQLHTAPVYLC